MNDELWTEAPVNKFSLECQTCENSKRDLNPVEGSYIKNSPNSNTVHVSSTNGNAIAALVLGILSAVFVHSLFIQVAAIITGGIGLSKANELTARGVEKTGRAMAIMGIVLGSLYLLRTFVLFMVGYYE